MKDTMSQGNPTPPEDELSFQEVFDHFLDFSNEVLKYNLSGELILKVANTKTNAVQSSLKGYVGVYKKTRNSPKHVEKFQAVYNQCKKKFQEDVDLDDFMEWFREQTFIILPQEKSRNKIHLNLIFRNCCRIADHLVQTAEENPDDRERYDNDPAALYPEQFMLHLFRIFSFCCSSQEKEEFLQHRVEELEERLGLSKNENPATSDGFADIFSTASTMAKSLGLNIPAEANISSTGFKEAMGQLSNNTQAQETIKGIFGGLDLSDPQNLPGTLSKILERMQESTQNIPEPVQKSMNAQSDQSVVPSSSH